MTNIIEDLNTITSIPRANLTKVFQRVEWLICNAAYEAYVQHDDIAEVNLAFGKLSMLFEDDTIRFKFQPSKKLEQALIQAFNEGIDPVAEKAEYAVGEILLKSYKDLL